MEQSSSKIEEIIDELEDFIDRCKPKFMSSSEIIVNRDEIEDLLRELRRTTPEEIKRYQKIISNKEAILNEARAKADNLVAKAVKQTNELISEHEIMQQAHAQAYEIISMAQEKAQATVDAASNQANAYVNAAKKYMDDAMEYLENVISKASQSATKNYEALINDLNMKAETLKNDRRQLHPEDSGLEGDSSN